jgi:NadR type nicotinamide-nucleotide adenylyltransferase
MEQRKVKKIVILGPESTGKSTMCIMLAEHFNTVWVKEYAREYLLKNGTNYTYENLYEIAQGQLAAEKKAIETLDKNTDFIFVDTDMYVMKVWSEYVFNKCDTRILNEIVRSDCDLYLLLNTDLPWEKDELREYPDNKTREKLFQFYKEEMQEQKKPWHIVSGQGKERFIHALNCIEKTFAISHS